MKSLIGRQFLVCLPVTDKSELESYCQIGRQGRGNGMLYFEFTEQLKDDFRAIESCASQSGAMLSKMR